MGQREPVRPVRWETIKPRFAALLSRDLRSDAIPTWLREWSDLEMLVWEQRGRLKRAMYLDMSDRAAADAFARYREETMAQLDRAHGLLIGKLLSEPGYQPLPPHVQLVRQWQNAADLHFDENAPILTEIEALEWECHRLLWSPSDDAAADPMIAPEIEAAVRDWRRANETAWRARHRRWLRHSGVLGTSFLHLLRLRRQLARNAGLPDYRAYRWRQLNRLDYTPEDAIAHHAAVAAEIVPLAAQWCARRCAELGIVSFRPWDFWADPDPHVPLRPYASVAELVQGAERILGRIDPEFGALFARMQDGYLYVEGGATKAAVNEEFFLPQTGVPCIFVNAGNVTGAADSSHEVVSLLLHETGHGLHDMISLREQGLFWNMGGPDEFCEFAATTTTLLASRYMAREQGGFYSPTQATQAQQAQLAACIGDFIPRNTMMDAFQHWVYGDAPDDLRLDDLDAKWDTLVRRYQPGVDWHGIEDERRRGWQQDWSLYTNPFYQMNYNLAQIGAMQVLSHALDDEGATIEAFKRALSLGNTKTLPELYQTAGAILPIDHQSITGVAQFAASALALSFR
jgi:oligoendopeptidase F